MQKRFQTFIYLRFLTQSVRKGERKKKMYGNTSSFSVVCLLKK
ncbi:hypothetical protein HMPREF9445_01650 [Bacteroides clarus YIT 12056]|uniref:Uncharacterized protein n=1 Tax=Bacteroides clarus YIT 12056 TaxID=762984 RepID=A0ABN0CNR1_9BACE|nr:hypothetical protein HMPREF9445_01650 [Bacteroides clarus YIT 12056]